MKETLIHACLIHASKKTLVRLKKTCKDPSESLPFTIQREPSH